MLNTETGGKQGKIDKMREIKELKIKPCQTNNIPTYNAIHTELGHAATLSILTDSAKQEITNSL